MERQLSMMGRRTNEYNRTEGVSRRYGIKMWKSPLSLAALILMIVPLAMGALPIFISPTGDMWNGRCDSITCTPMSPCSFPTAPDPNPADSTCFLVIEEGDYENSAAHVVNGDGSSSVILSISGTVTNLNLTLTADDVVVKSLNPGLKSDRLQDSLLTLIPNTSNSAQVDLLELSFSETFVTLTNTWHSIRVNDSTMITEGYERALVQWESTATPSIAILRSTFQALNGTIFQGHTRNALKVKEGELRSKTLEACYDATGETALSSSILTVSSSPIFCLAGATSLKIQGSTINSGTAGMVHLLPSANQVTPFSISHSHLTLINIAPAYSASFSAISSNFSNCGLLLKSNDLFTAPRILDTIVTFDTLGDPSASLTMKSTASDGSPFDIQQLRVESIVGYPNPFIIGGSPNFTTTDTSSIIADQLTLLPGTFMTIPNLTISTSIGLSDDSQPGTIAAIRPAFGPSTWRLAPILLTGVTLDMSLLDDFFFLADEDKYIHPIDTNIANTAALIVSPPNIRILWDGASLPIRNHWYTIALNFSSSVPYVQFVDQPINTTLNTSWDVVTHNISYLIYDPASSPISSPISSPPSSTTCPYIPNGFTCDNGQLISEGSIATTQITIPGGVHSVIIQGNLTISNTITFEGIGTTLVVQGCAYVQSVEVILKGDPTHDSLPTSPLLLLTQQSNCSNSLLETSVNVKTEKKTCKEVTGIVDQTTSSASQLSVVFRLDTKKCNTKWIILGCTLGGTAIIVIALALVFSLSTKARECIRPFSRQRIHTI